MEQHHNLESHCIAFLLQNRTPVHCPLNTVRPVINSLTVELLPLQRSLFHCRFEAAYVGFVGDHTVYVIPFLLILFNTFASQTIGILTLPLLLFWPVLRKIPINIFDKQKSSGETSSSCPDTCRDCEKHCILFFIIDRK